MMTVRQPVQSQLSKNQGIKPADHEPDAEA
jgi:hypothetical protein